MHKDIDIFIKNKKFFNNDNHLTVLKQKKDRKHLWAELSK